MIGWSRRAGKSTFKKTGERSDLVFEEWEFLFSSKNWQEIHCFCRKTSLFWTQTRFPVYFQLSYTYLQQKVSILTLVFLKNYKCLYVSKKTLLLSSKKIYNETFRQSQTYFAVNARYSSLFWTFNPCFNPFKTWRNWRFSCVFRKQCFLNVFFSTLKRPIFLKLRTRMYFAWS